MPTTSTFLTWQRRGEEHQPDRGAHQGEDAERDQDVAPRQPASGPLAAHEAVTGAPLGALLLVDQLSAPRGFAAEQVEDHRADAGDVAGTQGEHHVAGARPRGQGGCGVREALDEHDPVGRQRHGVGDQSPGDGGVGVLAGDVDVEDDDLVGRAELLPHLLAEDAGTGDEVGLEGDDHPAVAGHRARGLEVAADLDGVVGVGVEDPDAGDLALELHPAPGAGEGARARRRGRRSRSRAGVPSRGRPPRRGRSGGRGCAAAARRARHRRATPGTPRCEPSRARSTIRRSHRRTPRR